MSAMLSAVGLPELIVRDFSEYQLLLERMLMVTHGRHGQVLNLLALLALLLQMLTPKTCGQSFDPAVTAAGREDVWGGAGGRRRRW